MRVGWCTSCQEDLNVASAQPPICSSTKTQSVALFNIMCAGTLPQQDLDLKQILPGFPKE